MKYDASTSLCGDSLVFLDANGKRWSVPRGRRLSGKNREDDETPPIPKYQDQLDALKPFDNDLIFRVFINGESFRTIAKTLGLGHASSVQRRLAKILAALRRKLEADDDEPPTSPARVPNRPRPKVNPPAAAFVLSA